MRKLTRLFKDHKYLCFLDFEGTQFTHEMIAFGAVFVLLDKNGQIKRTKKPIKVYVKAKNKIGKYVEDLTHISEEQLKNEGVSFYTAMTELKKYCGLAFKKCSFVTFGSHDLRILNQSIAYSFDYPKEITSVIHKNFVDFQSFLNEYILDEKGSSYSLVRYCELFGIKEAGDAHDPRVDAINLANIYNAFVKNKELVADEYKKVLALGNHMPEPVAGVVKKLAAGQDVTAQDFEEEIKRYLS